MALTQSLAAAVFAVSTNLGFYQSAQNSDAADALSIPPILDESARCIADLSFFTGYADIKFILEEKNANDFALTGISGNDISVNFESKVTANTFEITYDSEFSEDLTVKFGSAIADIYGGVAYEQTALYENSSLIGQFNENETLDNPGAEFSDEAQSNVTDMQQNFSGCMGLEPPAH